MRLILQLFFLTISLSCPALLNQISIKQNTDIFAQNSQNNLNNASQSTNQENANLSQDKKTTVSGMTDLIASAENGNPNSQFTLAKELLRGKIIETDSIEACIWLYYSSCGGRDDLKIPEIYWNKEAANLLKNIAEDNSSPIQDIAKYYYGILCRDLYNNYYEAENNLYESYELGVLDAVKELAWLYYICDYDSGSIKTNMNGDQQTIQSNTKSSKRIQFRNRKHRYKNDNAEYWFNLFLELEDLEEIDRNEGLNYNWYLCNIYCARGDYKKAAITLEKFLELGNIFQGDEDFLRLADLYLASSYNSNLAYQIYRKYYRENQNEPDQWILGWTACGIGKCYYLGEGVPQSYTNAVIYFKIAEKNDDPEGTRLLSVCYRFGRGVTKDVSLAETLLNKAKELGDPTAVRIQTLIE